MEGNGSVLPPSSRTCAAHIAKWFPQLLLTLGGPDLESDFRVQLPHITDDAIGRALEVRLRRHSRQQQRPATQLENGALLARLSSHASDLESLSAQLSQLCQAEQSLAERAHAAAAPQGCSPFGQTPGPGVAAPVGGPLKGLYQAHGFHIPQSLQDGVQPGLPALPGAVAAPAASAGTAGAHSALPNATISARLEALESGILTMTRQLQEATVQAAQFERTLATALPCKAAIPVPSFSGDVVGHLAPTPAGVPHEVPRDATWLAREPDVQPLRAGSPSAAAAASVPADRHDGEPPAPICVAPPSPGPLSAIAEVGDGSQAATPVTKYPKDSTPRRGQARQGRQTRAENEGNAHGMGRSRSSLAKAAEWRSQHQVRIEITKLQQIDEEPMSPKGKKGAGAWGKAPRRSSSSPEVHEDAAAMRERMETAMKGMLKAKPP